MWRKEAEQEDGYVLYYRTVLSSPAESGDELDDMLSSPTTTTADGGGSGDSTRTAGPS